MSRMNIPFVDLRAQYQSIKEDIDQAIQEVLNTTSFIGGKYVELFEKEFARLYGVKHCISVGNGTDSLYIIMKMLGIGEGDEVITPANSWISSSETISQTGAKPVFIDVDPAYFTLDEKLLEGSINEHTKAIMPVHLYGQACDMKTINRIAKKHNLFVIEDCAQAHFSEFEEKRVGLFGDAGSFSFYPGKNLGAYGDAGCIITNNDELARKCKMYANHGAMVKHQHEFEGINSRLDAIQAAVLSVKLKHILTWTAMRIENAHEYTKQLSSISEIQTPVIRSQSTHTFHLFVIRTKRRNELKQYLESYGIACGIHYPRILPNLEAYSFLNLKGTDFPEAQKAEGEILSLPIYPELEQEQILYVANTIKDFYS